MLMNIEDLSFSYGVREIFKHINLTVQEGDAIGLIGRNGTGKSTLLKLITGELSPDSGSITKRNDLSIGYLEQTPSYDAKMTVEGLFYAVFEDLHKMEEDLRIMESQVSDLRGEAQAKALKHYGDLQDKFGEEGGYEYPSRIRGIARGIGFSEEDLKKPFAVLSGGEKTRVTLGMNLLKSPELLLLDEPTNYLDLSALAWLEQFLKAYSGTFIVISHDRYFLDRVVSQIVEVTNYHLESYRGNYSVYADQKEKKFLEQNHQYASQMKEIKRQEAIIARFRRYNSLHSSKRAASREKALAKMERPDPVYRDSQVHFNFEPKVRSGDDVLSVEDVAKSFGDQLLFEQVSFELQRGEKVGIIGPNGIGKTTLFRILENKMAPDSGHIEFGRKVYLGHFDQEGKDLRSMLGNNLIEALWDVDAHYNEGELRNILAAFLFTGDDVFKEIGSLSGGELARIALARLMLGNANFLLLDEPTNHIDMETKTILENALIAYQGTLLFISHDRYFLNRVATRILDFGSSGVTNYLGNYDDYKKSVDDTALRAEIETQTQANSPTKTQVRAERKKVKAQEAEMRAKKKEIVEIENAIEAQEKIISDLELEMTREHFYDDPDQVIAVTACYGEAKEELDHLTERWEALFLAFESEFET